jgi:hypothetical protein
MVVKDFMARRFSQVGDEILSDRDDSKNQMISDICVKSFLTRGWEGVPGSHIELRSKSFFLHPQALP